MVYFKATYHVKMNVEIFICPFKCVHHSVESSDGMVKAFIISNILTGKTVEMHSSQAGILEMIRLLSVFKPGVYIYFLSSFFPIILCSKIITIFHDLFFCYWEYS